MDSNLAMSVLSSLIGGSLVAAITYLSTRKRTGAETRKLDAEARRTQAETAKLLLEVGTMRASNMPGIQLPTGWEYEESEPGAYDVGVDSAVSHSGSRSGYIRSRGNSSGFGTLAQRIRGDRYQGKRIRLAGYVMTAGVEGWAGLWMRVDGPDGVISLDNMEKRGIHGTTEWTQHQIVLDVPEHATLIAFGQLLAGQGQAWVDDIEISIVSDRVPTTVVPADNEEWPDQPANLDFET